MKGKFHSLLSFLLVTWLLNVKSSLVLVSFCRRLVVCACCRGLSRGEATIEVNTVDGFQVIFELLAYCGNGATFVIIK